MYRKASLMYYLEKMYIYNVAYAVDGAPTEGPITKGPIT